MAVIEHLDLTDNHFLLKFRSEVQITNNFHGHKGMEFMYIYQGKGNLMLDSRMHEFKSGHLICFQPFQLHRIQQDITTDYIRSYVVFEPSLFDTYLAPFPVLRSFFHHMWKDQLSNQIFALDEEHPLVLLYEELHERCQKVPAASLAEEYGLFFVRFLCHLRPIWSEYDTIDCTSIRSLNHAEHIMDWVEKHYQEPFSIHELAKQLHLSPKHISSLFKQKTGGTITDYLMAKRLNQACLLLKTSSKPIGELCFECGFTNLSYFCQFFKKKMSITPYQYRKQFLEL
ncbi:AraC family transcriptional regulator [Paenibacillus agricola]|uniref:AraC family transcriptional regulator n=1 Tax=Paenibacillus agricola TaxID=2716264 RepID=A0ABX0J269_9BACL|nr:AraC family transcriptional regulator [Paenibacillus agricola]NHN28977.1 AraC family transcriptional regulator [Paenibacillus agricola]